MVKIKVTYNKALKSFDIESDLIGSDNRLIFSELVAGTTTTLKDLSTKMGIPKDALIETFCGALNESVLNE